MSTLNFEILPHFLRSQVLSCSATHDVLVYWISDGNNLAPFHLWWTQTMLKPKSLRSSVRCCLEYFLLLPISLRMHENPKKHSCILRKTDLLITPQPTVNAFMVRDITSNGIFNITKTTNCLSVFDLFVRLALKGLKETFLKGSKWSGNTSRKKTATSLP